MVAVLLGKADPAVEYADTAVPWWAVAMLDLGKDTQAKLWRDQIQHGVRNDGWEDPWFDLVDRARREFAGTTVDEVALAAREYTLKCVLGSPRAFCQVIGLQDDEQQPWMLKDFHVRGLLAWRQAAISVTLWPYMHGKSANSSLTLPLMDWAENVESTQIRVYRTQGMEWEATRRLMYEVENNVRLHRLCPWICRPQPGDPNEGTWGVRGFSLGGKQVVGYSFRPLTIGGTLTGLRADRIGVDDLVDEKNCTSYTTQDKMYNTLKSGVMTTRRYRSTWDSQYGTKWGTVYLVGTIYDRRDVNWRMYEEAKSRKQAGDKNYRVQKVKVFPHIKSEELGEVVWPEHRPLEFINELKAQLGYRAFRMRLMNTPPDDGREVFSAQDVDACVDQDAPYGERPMQGCRMVIGYDPATGKRTKGSAYPAAVALGYNPDEEHWWFIRYERWAGLAMPAQIKRLAEWAQWFGCPVVVEGNNIQESYADWMQQLYSSVSIKTFTTTSIKHDQADGVESFQPIFNQRRATICAKGAPDGAVSELRDEFVQWPIGRYTDLLMASWFAKWELDLQNRRWSPGQAPAKAPSYIRNRGLRRVVDMSRYRH